jgi:hypothetical protein
MNDEPVNKGSISQTQSLGNNLYFINEIEQKFVLKFQQLRLENPNKKVVCVWGSGTMTHGQDVGYYVLMEDVKNAK